MRVTSFVCVLSCCCASTIFAKPFVAVGDQTLQSDLNNFRQPSQSPDLNLFSPIESSALNTSLSKDAEIKCDGDEYGFNPDVDDCTSAVAHQQAGRTRFRFGKRGSVSTEKFFPLPYRLMGDEALCYLQPVLLNGAESGSATLSELREASSDLLLSCASKARQGGIATHFSSDKNLALVLGKYQSDLDCRGSLPSWKSCTTILSEMPASEDTLVFGPVTDPRAQIPLPYMLESDDRKCLARIWYMKRESDTASWYNMWEALTAVYSVCLRQKKGGIVRGLGDHSNLFVTITSQVGSLNNMSLEDTTSQ